MPGYGESGEGRVSSETTIVELFYGTGLASQVITLAAVPLLPIVVEKWNATKQIWEPIDETKYTIAEGSRTITLAATEIIPLAAAPPSNKNIRVTYVPTPASYGGSEIGLEGVDAVTGLPPVIELRGANPTEGLDIVLSPRTGKAKIIRLVVTRTHQAGTAYDIGSMRVETYDINYAAGPTADGENTLTRDTAGFVTAGGNLINRTNRNLGDCLFINLAALYLGVLSIEIAATGGDPTSEEDYLITIQGLEVQ